MKKKIILVGPYPPPYHGTSIPLKHLDDYINTNDLADTIIVSSLTRNNVPVYHPLVVKTYLSLFISYLKAIPRTDIVLITGSQGFISTIGCLLVIIAKNLYRKHVSIYVHGGGFDNYYSGLNSVFRFLVQRILSSTDHLIVQTKQNIWARFYPQIFLILWLFQIGQSY